MGAPKVWMHHPELDSTVEVNERRANSMLASGWEPCNAPPEPPVATRVRGPLPEPTRKPVGERLPRPRNPYAAGGFVVGSGVLARLGESGPEAVIPLSQIPAEEADPPTPSKED